MGSHTPVEDDPEQLAEAQKLWNAFTAGSKWSIILIAITLIVLLFAFVPMG